MDWVQTCCSANLSAVLLSKVTTRTCKHLVPSVVTPWQKAHPQADPSESRTSSRSYTPRLSLTVLPQKKPPQPYLTSFAFYTTTITSVSVMLLLAVCGLTAFASSRWVSVWSNLPMLFYLWVWPPEKVKSWAWLRALGVRWCEQGIFHFFYLWPGYHSEGAWGVVEDPAVMHYYPGIIALKREGSTTKSTRAPSAHVRCCRWHLGWSTASNIFWDLSLNLKSGVVGATRQLLLLVGTIITSLSFERVSRFLIM